MDIPDTYGWLLGQAESSPVQLTQDLLALTLCIED